MSGKWTDANGGADETSASGTSASDRSPRHFLTVNDLSPSELATVLDAASEMKAARTAGAAAEPPLLPRRTAAMLFEKPSTRTRVSFETGMTQLGGHSVFLGPDDTHLGRGEPVSDTARVLSRYADFVVARVFDHGTLETLAEFSSVPVVNALSDAAHPCQALADLLTLRSVGTLDDLSVAWVGDGNNVAASFAVAAATAGVEVTAATPAGYELPESVLDRAANRGPKPSTTHDPEEAVAGADVVYTDVWVSMGEEDQRDEKLADFEGFQVNDDLLAQATDRDGGSSHPAVMHCLPAHRGEEITGDVLESGRSLVWEQAENRLHTQKALLAHLAGVGDAT